MPASPPIPMDLDQVDVRGLKRKAEAEPPITRRIKRLDEDVVNKIAAGEIIVAPVHAVKELLENCVDAGATSIEIQATDGGMKMLQIQDNGCGIEESDLPILCERFTTSKLRKFEDLTALTSYGFRGEALASISHIAHLKVTTKTADSPVSWTAKYGDGKLTSPPTKAAGTKGTRITVEDLFYNIPMRRRAFRSGSEEMNKIIDMVSKYAIHCWSISFTCRKIEARGAPKAMISISGNDRMLDRIRHIYGSAVGNELFEFSASDKRWGFKAKGWASNANFSVKKFSFILFINNRCVESSQTKKVIEQTYSAFLPKGGHPWVYLSIEIDPSRIDVNVHPTKREVTFLNEDEIVHSICDELRTQMAAVDSSRTFYTQTLLPGAPGASNATQPAGSSSYAVPTSKKKGVSRNDATLVRTDANARKITSMLSTVPSGGGPSLTSAIDTVSARIAQITQHKPPPGSYPIRPGHRTTFVRCSLQTIRDLRDEVRDNKNNELTEILASHTWIGVAHEHRRLVVIQSRAKLYLVNYFKLTMAYFYQMGLVCFGNFPICTFDPMSIHTLLVAAAESEKQKDPSLQDDPDFIPEDIATTMVAQLVERREMLMEYFSLEITPSGELLSFPRMPTLAEYIPSLSKISTFLYRLGPNVDWTHEKRCFESFLKELALFYTPERLPTDEMMEDGSYGEGDVLKEDKAIMEERRRQMGKLLEDVIFPDFKEMLVAPESVMRSSVIEVANLKGLYRVFERC